ncbi:MAG: DNA polymerase III subunit delta', partial [Microbacteriaceae bacterium]|nr:DNA polymerase III subunit delta' [Microbacteriaceae bacterium]
STLAHGFAAELVGAGLDEARWKRVIAGAHPDVSILATDRVTITIEEVRALVSFSYFSPSQAPYRVVVIEDADRMTDRTSNVLLKALEEPPPQTVWILCAPSPADVLPTIRSRMRSVNLVVPTVDDVARLISQREGVEEDVARMAATESQNHIGMATRLATDPEARSRRDSSVQAVLNVISVSGAVKTAAELLELCKQDAAALVDRLDSKERESLLHSLGIAPGGAVPAAVRSHVKSMEDDQKRRATRSLRDAVDRVLVDVMSLLRDVLMIQVGAEVGLINVKHQELLSERAAGTTAELTMSSLDAIDQARARMAQNSPPLLVLEALLIELSGKAAVV